MKNSLEFVKDRAVKTISAAKQVAPSWTWEEKTAAQMEAQLAAITGNATATPPVRGQEANTSAADQVMLAARGAYDTALDQLHTWTAQGLGMAKTKFRDDTAKAAQLAGLGASGSSRAKTLDEALAWESAWANIDPTWAPLPGLTPTTFTTLRKRAYEVLKPAYSDAHAAWRKAAETLGEMAGELTDMSQAWYATALRVFPEGTAEGDLIRGTIPTTYSPPPPAPASPAPPPQV